MMTISSKVAVKEHPIIFSTPMVQAILEGRKTQTRRVMKPQPWDETLDHETGYWNAVWQAKPKEDYPRLEIDDNDFLKFCPYGQTGDILWVRESFHIWSIGGGSGIYYKADYPNDKIERWKPSIHMPKEACRIWLKIINIKAERVQDISEEDALAEGIECWDSPTGGDDYQDYYKNYAIKKDSDYIHAFHFTDAVSSYKSLWKVINGEESWSANPWVWVIEFEKLPTQ